MKHISFTLLLFTCIFISSCGSNDNNVKKQASNSDKQNAIEALIIEDSSVSQIPIMVERIKKIKTVLSQKTPIILLDSLNETATIAQKIAIADSKFSENLFDKKTHQAYRNEIFNVYAARPQEVPSNLQN